MISITYSECLSVVVVVEHAMGMRQITLSYVVWPAVQYFSHCLINGRILGGGGGIIEYTNVFCFCSFETFAVFRM